MRPDYAARYARIVELRKQGLSSTQIGLRLGMTSAAVRVCVSNAKRSMAADEKLVMSCDKR